ncbi:hypothetical protein AVEN_207404-1 [Araneus ventricosus]|uniref:Reverse transcriptase/retrotransposon-derived protein RNase H-like domain-containing protein n=1 Tax=Araneus ventricosus TaxID=182803 RepID=A0A4Y2JAF5_ARAVE|nr:hypothetical protein AVEN_207404-1 [Araneus ventricosus]
MRAKWGHIRIQWVILHKNLQKWCRGSKKKIFCSAVYIKHASAVQAPLFDLVKSKKRKDKSRIEWNESTLQTFEDCKQTLSNAALLALNDPSASLSLYTDASDIAIGAVLQQNAGRQSEPLAFFLEN